ncbi:hypothetical protein T8S45_09495 [Blastomonas marina]|uniref:hypothetical protein n=1 Tax=Blastomonas marina TaxID=1867408 RepID=UPI002AC94E8C|nr:hypothetical protein [Blastomonas marina]WPZ03075.1 hypothetical protein T8S45_09495 [Blastomonas marina]
MIDHALSAARLNLELGRYTDVLEPLEAVERHADRRSDLSLEAKLLRMRLALRLNEYELLSSLSDEIAEEAPANAVMQFERERIINTALRDHGDYEHLPASIDRLVSLAQRLPNEGGSKLHRALSRSLAKIGEVEHALESAQQAVQFAHDENDMRAIGNANLAYAEALRYAGEERQAVEYYRSGIDIGRDIGNRDSELWSWLGLACAYLQIEEYGECQNALKAAHHLTAEPGFDHPIETAHVGLIEALTKILSKSSTDLEGVLKPYALLGISWPEKFVSETQREGRLPSSIPI